MTSSSSSVQCLHRIYVCAAFIGIYLLSPFFLPYSFSARAAVVINEIFPKSADITQQWIELYNNGSDSVSLDRWTLENSADEKKVFMLNASAIIQGNSYLTIGQTQSGIKLSPGGDTVRLTNEKNEVMDTQSYPGTLGYNVSMGRSMNGGGSWAPCTSPTQNQPNNCPPLPTSSPTLTPTLAPTVSPTPSVLLTSTPVPTPILTPTSIPPNIPYMPSPTPFISNDTVAFEIPKSLLIQIAIIAVAWGLLAIIAKLRSKPKHPHQTKISEHPTGE